MSTAELQLIKDVNDAGERERGRGWEGAGGKAATCCVQLCSKVSPTSAEKLSQETMSTLWRGGRALHMAPYSPAIAAASLTCQRCRC